MYFAETATCAGDEDGLALSAVFEVCMRRDEGVDVVLCGFDDGHGGRWIWSRAVLKYLELKENEGILKRDS